MNFKAYTSYESNFNVLDQVCITLEEIPDLTIQNEDGEGCNDINMKNTHQGRGRSRSIAPNTAATTNFGSPRTSSGISSPSSTPNGLKQSKGQQYRKSLASSFSSNLSSPATGSIDSNNLTTPSSTTSASAYTSHSSSLSSPTVDNISTPSSKSESTKFVSPGDHSRSHCGGSIGSSTSSTTPQYVNQRKQRSMKKSGWLGRQIAAAYDEHASIINDLRSELHKSKQREQALIDEFKMKFQELHKNQVNMNVDSTTMNPTSASASFSFDGNPSADGFGKLHNATSTISATTTSTSPSSYEEEDMPMDEMADTARQERNARQNDAINQRLILQQFKQKSDEKIYLLRQQSEKQIKSIEKALKEKVREIDLLKQEAKKIAKERNYYKTQNSVEVSVVATTGGRGGNGMNGGMTSSPGEISSLGADGHTSIGEYENNEESILMNSFTLQNHSTPSPLTVHNNGSKNRILQRQNPNVMTSSAGDDPSQNDDDDVAIYNQLLSKPAPSTPQGISSCGSNVAPIDRMRRGKSNSPQTSLPVQSAMQQQTPNLRMQQQQLHTPPPPAGSPPTPSISSSEKKQFNFSNSAIAVDGSAYESGVMSSGSSGGSSSSSSSSPSSSAYYDTSTLNDSTVDHSTSSSTLPTPRKLDTQQPQQQPSLDKLIEIFKVRLSSSNSSPTNSKSKNTSNASIDHLSEEERRYAQTIHELFHSHYNKPEGEVISSLTTKLQQATIEIQAGASKASQMSNQIQEQQELIQDLETQLDSTYASIRNTKDLEGLLKMVANDYKNDQNQRRGAIDENIDNDDNDDHGDNMDLKQKLRDLEEERDELQTVISYTEEESVRSVSAIQRVMAELSAAKDEEIEKLNAQVDELKHQVELWSKRNNPPAERSESVVVLVEQTELTKLQTNARHYLTVKDENDELKIRLEKDQLEKNELKSALEEMQSASDHAKTTGQDEIEQLDKLDELKKQNTEIELQLKKQNAEMELQLKEKMNIEQQLRDDLEKAVTARDEHERTIVAIVKSKEEMETQIVELSKEKQVHEEQMIHAEEVLKTAKLAHEREQKLEDELSELRNLLDGTMKNKTALRDSLKSREDQLHAFNREYEAQISDLQSKIITMKEEKLELKKKLRKAEEASIRTVRVLSALQETGEIENSGPQIVMDMKDHIREQHSITNELRQTCDEQNMEIVEKLNEGFNTTLCLLDAAILGNAIESPKAASDVTHWNNSTKATLDAQLNMIRKEIEQELKNERDQETTVMNSELALLKEKNEQLVDMLTKKDEEMRILRSSLKESSVGYISGDDSDLEDDTVPSNIPLQYSGAGLPSERVEEILRAKDKAEKEVKENADRLTNAKMIISSLEQSNKTITEDFKSRLHDSNAAIASLLEQSSKQEKEIDELKSLIGKLKSKNTAVESKLSKMKINNEAQNSNENSSSLSVVIPDDSSQQESNNSSESNDCVGMKDQNVDDSLNTQQNSIDEADDEI